MEIFAAIGQNPLPAIVFGIIIVLIIKIIQWKNTHNYFCTDCGRFVGRQFTWGRKQISLYRACPKCGNNVASPFNTGQGTTHRQGRRNY